MLKFLLGTLVDPKSSLKEKKVATSHCQGTKVPSNIARFCKTGMNLRGLHEKRKGKWGKEEKYEKSDKTHVKIPL